MVVGALLIAKSRALYQGMTCLSMLPLFHIAGVSRNLAPLLLEGCIIFSGPFNPGFFWEILDCNTVNYYAATPTMHQALLEAGRYSSHLPGHDTIGMIESVGGALAPSLAEELAEWFTAKVMQVRAAGTPPVYMCVLFQHFISESS
jgi:acyl-CoA synthetase (AMP-forming)/AMP-acid ligase II